MNVLDPKKHKFLSTPSARRATQPDFIADFYFIFLSTPSARRATSSTFTRIMGATLFLSTPSARRATRRVVGHFGAFSDFYPRPPRGGRRPCGCPRTPGSSDFYPRPPRGGRPMLTLDGKAYKVFLSTPSARRATRSFSARRPFTWHFYPRPPRGGRQQKQRQNLYFQTNYTTFCTNLEEP